MHVNPIYKVNTNFLPKLRAICSDIGVYILLLTSNGIFYYSTLPLSCLFSLELLMKFHFMEDKEICAASPKKNRIVLFVAVKYSISGVHILLVVFLLLNLNVSYERDAK